MNYRCPHDGGACHHGCVPNAIAENMLPPECWRQKNCGALSEPWPGFPVHGSIPVPEDMICTGCQHPMVDAGPVGIECVNAKCPDVIRIKESVRKAFSRGESIQTQAKRHMESIPFGGPPWPEREVGNGGW